MAVAIEIKNIPIGSQFTSTIGADDLDDQNDFRVKILLDANGTGLTEDGITLSAGASLVSLTGSNSAWEATVRPPVTAGTLTFTVDANAFTEGNTETTLDIRVSTAFPDTDAEVPTELFSQTGMRSITVTPTRIYTGSFASSVSYADSFLHDGTELTSERIGFGNFGSSDYPISLDFFNDTLLLVDGQYHIRGSVWRYDLDGNRIATYSGGFANVPEPIMHTPDGILKGRFLLPYDQSPNTAPTELTGDTANGMANDGNLIYARVGAGTERRLGRLLEIVDGTEMRHIRYLNIAYPDYDGGAGVRRIDASLYRDTLYLASDNGVYTVDIRPYRPLAKNTKTTIYPVFANEGDTIPLKQYCPDAHHPHVWHRL